MCADGSVCRKWFPNIKASHANQRFAQDGEHGSQLHATALVVTNQCPMCSSIFSSIAYAKQHLRFALLRGIVLLIGPCSRSRLLPALMFAVPCVRKFVLTILLILGMFAVIFFIFSTASKS